MVSAPVHDTSSYLYAFDSQRDQLHPVQRLEEGHKSRLFNANFLAGLTSDDLGTYLKMKDVERSVPRVKREHEAIDNENADAMAVADFDGLEGLAAQ